MKTAKLDLNQCTLLSWSAICSSPENFLKEKRDDKKKFCFAGNSVNGFAGV